MITSDRSLTVHRSTLERRWAEMPPNTKSTGPAQLVQEAVQRGLSNAEQRVNRGENIDARHTIDSVAEQLMIISEYREHWAGTVTADAGRTWSEAAADAQSDPTLTEDELQQRASEAVMTTTRAQESAAAALDAGNREEVLDCVETYAGTTTVPMLDGYNYQRSQVEHWIDQELLQEGLPSLNEALAHSDQVSEAPRTTQGTSDPSSPEYQAAMNPPIGGTPGITGPAMG